ncbi:methyltransferase [Lithospermum erythrorhizon]|uniref:Methyltransferase n=1 Tax=Lithospermum erythrorhizon TaxID=34254 RepID=A0AAV3PPV3_LITER
MEILQILHMNKGEGESSYSNNSFLQKKILSIGYSTIREAMKELLRNNFPESMGVADLGCSSGPNTLAVISEIIDILCKISCQMSRPMPELRISLNDLPGNDFNGVFLSLPEFYDKIKKEKGDYLESCYVSGVPGTFYGRLFPRNSQHFVHSSSSIHWLSQVPPSLDSNNTTHHLNKGKIYISKSSPSSVLNAYLVQFQNDFHLFLKSRSEEIVPGGRMVLSLMSRSSPDPTGEESCYQWELLARALMSMASEGLVEEEKIDSFNAPYYAPSLEEVKNEIEQEGSFVINSTEAFEVEWDACCPSTQLDNKFWGITGNNNLQSRGQSFANTIRAVVEPMLVSYFGYHIMDEVFRRFRELVDEYYVIKARPPYYINLVISLSKKV